MPFPILPVLAGANLAVTTGRAVFGKKDTIEDPSSGQRQTLLRDLLARLNATGGSPTDSPVFRSSVGGLQNVLADQETQDRARLAQLGAGGAELEIAQGAARNRALATGTAAAVGNAAQFQEGSRNAVIAQILSALGQQTQSAMAVEGRKEQRRGRIGSSLSSALQAAVLADFHAQNQNTATA